MIEQGLFKRHFVGRDGFIWWIGQIVSENEWVQNIPGRRTPTTSDHEGFDYRYKVRIMGYHTASPNDLTDEELPWASVMLPVTAGAGSGGSSQTPNLRQGNFVYGFFLDGEDAQQPIIIGVIGFNQYTAISKEIPPVPFLPFSGFTNRDTVPRYSFTTSQEESDATQEKNPGQTQSQNNSTVTESNVSLDNGRSDAASKEQYENAKKKNPVPKTSKCEPASLGQMQRQIKNMIAEIERIQRTVNDWATAVSTKIENIEREINRIIDDAAKFIAGGVKWIITEIQKFVINKINNTAKDFYYLLFPSQRPDLKNKMEKANVLIACLFRRIISNLLSMIGKFLLQAVDRFINAPLCAVENFIGAILGQLIGFIKSGLDLILKPIQALLGVFDIGQAIMGFIRDILSFLSCEETPSCPEITEWSIWEGGNTYGTIDINSIVNKVEDFASSFSDSIDFDNFNFDLDFESAFQDSCNVGPIFCGPPTVSFFGGGGEGATGNAIISATGDILGVDIITPGSGYSSEPFVRFEDACGNGVGASGRSVINENGEVIRVIINESGTGYLPSPNGSFGGDGRVWAEPGTTIVKRSDGRYESPYNPGDVFGVNPGDTVQYPNQPPILIDESQTITAPNVETTPLVVGPNPTFGSGNYPVVLELGDVYISDPGYNYTNEDSIIISPNNGSELSFNLNDVGSVSKVNIVRSGIGFTDFPDIYIQSNTGYNSKLIPIFNVVRVGDIPQEEVSTFTSLINVIDCVGKV